MYCTMRLYLGNIKKKSHICKSKIRVGRLGKLSTKFKTAKTNLIKPKN